MAKGIRNSVLGVGAAIAAVATHDLVQKRQILERAGCPHYWAVDPEALSLWAWRLVDGAYVLDHHVGGSDELSVTEPVEMNLRLSELLP